MTSRRSCVLLRSFISVSSAYIPFPRTPSLLLSRSSLFVSISLALPGPGFLSTFLSLARPPPLLFPRVFMCENCGVCFDVGSILSSKDWCKRILLLKTERDLNFFDRVCNADRMARACLENKKRLENEMTKSWKQQEHWKQKCHMRWKCFSERGNERLTASGEMND